MLKDCLEIFEKEVKKYKEKNPKSDDISFITDDYVLSFGTYILLDLETGEIKEALEINKENISDTSDLYRKFAKFEYIGEYIDSNKAVSDKNIFSNNIYSFIIKKENILSKITEKEIDKYYDAILNFSKTKDADKKKLYTKYEEEFGKTNTENADKAKEIIKNFIKNCKQEKTGKLSIFFDVDFEEYKKEANRYFLANIYNSNKYNYLKNDEIFGLPNNNMGLNDKKPYIKNRTRKNVLPYAISQEEVLRQKLFFDYLEKLSKQNKKFLYFTEEKIIKSNSPEFREKNISGYYIRLEKGKECAIVDCAIVCNKNDKMQIKFDNILNIDHSKQDKNFEYKKYTSLSEFISIADIILYNKYPRNDYYSETEKIKMPNDKFGNLKEILVKTREFWIDWEYKGRDFALRKNFGKLSFEIIKNSIKLSNIQKAQEQFNLRMALIKYFSKEENNMAEKIKKIVETLEEKINSKANPEIETDEEYYFAIGQLANYFISLNKSKDKKHYLFLPILQSKNNDKLKKMLKSMFNKYSYEISTNSLRFNNLYGMVCRYEAQNKINTDLMCGGYLYQSLIYKKNNEEEGEEK